MDGASKFVRGDAIAGIIIMLINLIGGLAIGMAQHSLSFSEAGHTYTLLTIGDGLVAQIPSMLLSTASRPNTPVGAIDVCGPPLCVRDVQPRSDVHAGPWCAGGL